MWMERGTLGMEHCAPKWDGRVESSPAGDVVVDEVDR